MKEISYIAICTIAFALALTNFAFAAPGDLDPTFGIGGKLTDWPGSARAKAVAIQPDGKIIVVGGYGSGVHDFRMARYNPDGTPDTTFGGGTGRVITDFGGRDDATNVVIQPDGRILVAGTSQDSSFGHGGLALARYNSDGSLDASFGNSSGKVHTLAPCFYAPYGRVGDVAIQPDGRIVGSVGMGDGDGNCENAGLLVRYHTDGSLDTSFGSNGMVSTLHALWSVALQPSNGRIVAVAGYWGLARFNTNGSPDSGFGASGLVTLPPRFSAAWDSVAFDSEGRIVAAVRVDNGFSVVRFDSNGSLDSSFDDDGIVTTPISAGYSPCYSLVIQTNGKIVAAGATSPDHSGTSYDFALARYNSNGSLDTTFGGGDGIATVDFGSSNDLAYEIAVDNAGRAVVVGESDGRFAIARFLGDSAPATNANISGRVSTPDGRGLRGALVSLTDSLGITRTATTSSFGMYSFTDIPVGGAFTISVSSRRYRFAPRTITANGNLTNIDFAGIE